MRVAVAIGAMLAYLGAHAAMAPAMAQGNEPGSARIVVVPDTQTATLSDRGAGIIDAQSLVDASIIAK